MRRNNPKLPTECKMTKGRNTKNRVFGIQQDAIIASQACPWEWDSHENHPMGWDGMG